MICNIHVFLPPVVTGNYISYKFFSKKSKNFNFITPYHLFRWPVILVLCILLGLLPALSYSDMVKSWRGECGGIGIGPYCMYGLPYMYVCVCARRPRQGHCKCT